MITVNKIYNEDCLSFLTKLEDGAIFDVVLTSPPYNTSRDCEMKEYNNKPASSRYIKVDGWRDNRTQQEYIDWCTEIFNQIEPRLKENGVIIWNVSYGGDVTTNVENIDTMWLSIADIIKNTKFTVADRIIWKKSNCLPNNVSPNKLDRIVEDIFIFARKTEIKTFHCNKKVTSTSATGQKYYSPIKNLIEASNNSEVCPLNKATFSEDLVMKLLNIYAPKKALVYDPFMGTGTTAVGCLVKGCNFIGTEISNEQIEWANNRIKKYQKTCMW